MEFRNKWYFILMGIGTLLIIGGALTVVLVHYRTPKHKPRDLFEKHILKPVPDSVMDIRVDQPVSFRGHGYVFRFHVSPSEVASIVDARPFKRVFNVRYDQTAGLQWDWSPSNWVVMAIYSARQLQPSWFRPEQWHDPEAYAFEDREGSQSIQVLLYNAELEQAYYVICSEFN